MNYNWNAIIHELQTYTNTSSFIQPTNECLCLLSFQCLGVVSKSSSQMAQTGKYEKRYVHIYWIHWMDENQNEQTREIKWNKIKMVTRERENNQKNNGSRMAINNSIIDNWQIVLTHGSHVCQFHWFNGRSIGHCSIRENKTEKTGRH